MVRLVCLLICLAGPGAAQTAQDDPLSEGVDLLGQGTRLLLEGLMDRMAPALQGLETALDDLHGYHPPEILPNGDILIRRRQPGEGLDPPADGEIDL